MNTDLINKLVELRRQQPSTKYFLEEIRAAIWSHAEDLVKLTIKDLKSPLEEVCTDAGFVSIWHDSERPCGGCLDDCAGLGFPDLEDIRDSFDDADWDYSFKKSPDGSVDDYAAIDFETVNAWIADLEEWRSWKPRHIVAKEISGSLVRKDKFFREHQDEGPATE